MLAWKTVRPLQWTAWNSGTKWRHLCFEMLHCTIGPTGSIMNTMMIMLEYMSKNPVMWSIGVQLIDTTSVTVTHALVTLACSLQWSPSYVYCVSVWVLVSWWANLSLIEFLLKLCATHCCNLWTYKRCRDSCICLSVVQIGGTYAKAILLPNEVAIGAIGRIQVTSIILLLFVSDTAFNFL